MSESEPVAITDEGMVHLQDLNLAILTPEEKQLAIMLLSEKSRRAKQRKILTYYPDTGPLRRDLYPKQQAFFAAGIKHRERCIMAANRVGKMQPYSSMIQTPQGPRRMGDLEEGDYVFGEDGRPHKVLAIFDHGIQPIFRVMFDDRSCTRCGADHLWSFIHPKDRFEYKNSHGKRTRVKTYRNRTVASLSEVILIGGTHPKPLRRIAVPVTSPVEFENRDPLPISPYLMGSLLGDGCFQKECIKFSNVDPEILDRVGRELPPGLALIPYGGCDYGLSRPIPGGGGVKNPIQEVLRNTGLYNARSYDKFIPDLYKFRPSDDRFDLLRGLMDTDGTIYGSCQMELSTSSPKLAEDVQWLVQSLGGKAYIDPKLTTHRIHYRVSIEIQSGNPFYLPRKADKFFKVSHKPDRLLYSIEYDGEEKARCILVDSPEHTYLTDNFIVTHNTEGCTCYEASLHMTGWYPKWWKGRRFDKPVRVWFAGTSAETTRDILQRKLLGPLDELGTGLIPGETIIGEPKKDSGIPNAVETFQVRHKSGGISRGQFKAYKQGRKSFEGDEQDVIVLDEEPPLEIYSECLLRTMTTNGIILLGFTPKEGLTETVLAFMPGGIVPENGINGTKFIVGATWDDAPHLSEEAKKEILEGTPIHLRSAVSRGIPQIGSGAIFPIDEEDVQVDDFPIPEYWPRVYALDVGWKATAATWLAWDRENDIVYIYNVYKRGQAEPSSHAEAIKSRGIWIPGTIDPASRGRSQYDGKKLMDEYEDLGLDLTPADNAVEAGIFEVYKRLSTGRLKVFKSCRSWFEEFRIYRRDKHGRVVKENDHLMDCTRYGIMTGLSIAKVFIQSAYRNMSVTQIMNRIPLGRA